MLKGFKDFIMRGNIVDLAVAFVMGVAFAAVISAFTKDFIGGIIGAIGGTADFGNAGFTVNGSKIVIGSTITALINFVIVAAVLYFVVVVPLNKAAERRRGGAQEPAELTGEEQILTEIRDLLARRG